MQGQIPRILAERIVCDKNILTGKPVIKGTRLAVEFIIGLLGHGWTEAEILENLSSHRARGYSRLSCVRKCGITYAKRLSTSNEIG